MSATPTPTCPACAIAGGVTRLNAIADPFCASGFRFAAPHLQTRNDADRYLAESVLPPLDKFVSGAGTGDHAHEAGERLVLAEQLG